MPFKIEMCPCCGEKGVWEHRAVWQAREGFRLRCVRLSCPSSYQFKPRADMSQALDEWNEWAARLNDLTANGKPIFEVRRVGTAQ